MTSDLTSFESNGFIESQCLEQITRAGYFPGMGYYHLLKLMAAVIYQRHDEAREMVLWHEVLHAWRQKLRLIDLPGAKMLAHGGKQNQTRRQLNSDYSDRLLEKAG